MNVVFSIIIPYYDKPDYILRALDSVADQTFKDLECIVVDDGSDLRSILMAHKITSDARFRFIYQTNQGVATARNVGFREASGRYVLFLDADDRLDCGLLFRLYEILSGEDCEVIQYRTMLIDEGSNEVIPFQFRWRHTSDAFRDILRSWDVDLIIPIHSRIYKREILYNHGILFDPELKNKEDWDFLLQVHYFNPRTFFLSYDGCYYYVGTNENRSRNLGSLLDGFSQIYCKWSRVDRRSVEINKCYLFLSLLTQRNDLRLGLLTLRSFQDIPSVLISKFFNKARLLSFIIKRYMDSLA